MSNMSKYLSVGRIAAERSSALHSSPCVADQQRVGSSPSLDTCVLEQYTKLPLLHPSNGWDIYDLKGFYKESEVKKLIVCK